jgi:hypothetical protein
MTDELHRITRVAIQYNGKIYSLPAPNRHHDVIRMIAKENGVGVNGPDVQGFLDEAGTFLHRRSAFVIAQQTGQLNRKSGGYQGDRLYSEDLW